MTPPPATTAAARKASTAAATNAAAQASSVAEHRLPAPAQHQRPAAGPAASTRLGATRTRTPERTTRRSVRQPGTAPRSPRRISGPTRPANPAARAATFVARKPAGAGNVATEPAPRERARRGTATGATQTRTARSSVAAPAPKARVTLTAPRRLSVRALIPHPRLRADSLLDRIVRGRAWIPVLGVALIGIVAMQVEVLKLGSSVGRSMNTATELSGQIQIERAQLSALESPSRIELLAARYGLAQPGPTDNHFVSAHTSVQKAIAGIRAPDATAFKANLLKEEAVDDVTSTQAAEAAEATDAGTAPNLADDTATGSSAAAETPAGAGSAATDSSSTTALTNTVADSTPLTTAATGDGGGATNASSDAPTSDTGATDSPAAPVAGTGGSALSGATAVATSGPSGTLDN